MTERKDKEEMEDRKDWLVRVFPKSSFPFHSHHSHSVVPGGFEVRSYMTRDMPGTTFTA